ncbi:hypothetical protein AMECASPLE_015109 [Ameca splendens]|uniref:Uncharacterized protein n=1 Tax=Ameca splendens TaxID=208324 RepID=A0ABV0Y1N2_9TELE
MSEAESRRRRTGVGLMNFKHRWSEFKAAGELLDLLLVSSPETNSSHPMCLEKTVPHHQVRMMDDKGPSRGSVLCGPPLEKAERTIAVSQLPCFSVRRVEGFVLPPVHNPTNNMNHQQFFVES